ncbi:MAG: hypothetical protein MUF75_00960 [Bacteroidia bacterium]|jgi:Flp pilus assembly protein TadD|nr:hypothetical protein [Bacteroidia bacterium]
MKTTLVAAFLILAGLFSQAQTLQEIVAKTENERYDLAENDLRSLISKNPGKGEYYFYFAENFYKKGDTDSARVFYNKGIATNATYPLNYVGLGKCLLLESKTDEAKTQFYKANTLGAGKNAELLRKTAEAWLITDIKNPDEAMNLANAAIKLEPKNPENYILLGDAQLEKNPSDGSTPIKNYNTATTLNPKNVKGILRIGKLYQRGRNYQLALEKYREALVIDSTFAPAFREIAELYYLAGQPAKSIENWQKYLKLNNSDYARYRYMAAFFSNKQYAEAVREYESLKKTGFSNLYFERLAGYSYYEMGDKTDKEAYNKGLFALDAFFNLAGADFKYIATDYKYKGLLLLKTGKDSLANTELNKAMSLEPKLKPEIYSELAANAMRLKKYDAGSGFYELKYQSDSLGFTSSDYYSLGRAYFYSALALKKEASEVRDSQIKKKKPTETPEVLAKEDQAKTLFIKADSAFSKTTQKSPTWPIGYFWRARANSYLDPSNALWQAKPYYEKMISLITKPEERTGTYKSNLIEAYEYLGAFYVTANDKVKADETWNLVKDLDPANEKAKNYFAPPKPKPAAPKSN